MPGDPDLRADPTGGPSAPPGALPHRRLVLALTMSAAVTSAGGGLALLTAPPGHPALPPLAVLAHTPFRSFLVPGLLLALVVGGSSLAAAVLVWRRSRAAVDATLLAGGAMTVWILAEAAMLRELNGLHLVYGALGLLLGWLGAVPAWRSGVPRHRWVLTVTAAQALGSMAPAAAAVLIVKARLDGATMVGLLVGASLIEGLALGAGQAAAFPLPVRRARYALATALALGVAWLLATSAALAPAAGLPPGLGTAGGLLAAPLAALGVGGAQWLVLRRHAARAHRWIAWAALATAAALVLGSTPVPFLDAATPVAASLALWASAALLVGYATALVTWQGARRLAGSPTGERC